MCGEEEEGWSRSMDVGIEIVLVAELAGDGDAGEVLAPLTLDGVDVEENGQR